MAQPISTTLLPEFQEIHVTSSLDGSREPSLLWMPGGGEAPTALVVGLHTWSADRFNQQGPMLEFCEERRWALLLPEFRGPNLEKNPRATEAGGSRLACRDIVDATREAQNRLGLENTPVFLHGGSGGGHMALQTSAREDFAWTAVSSWCPITDLAAWHEQNKNYSRHIAAVCGGPPNATTAHEYHDRSPLHRSEALAKINLLLAHGRQDASVPQSHSWRLATAIESHNPRQFYFQIFDGTHEIHHDVAFRFFDRCIQRQNQSELTG